MTTHGSCDKRMVPPILDTIGFACIIGDSDIAVRGGKRVGVGRGLLPVLHKKRRVAYGTRFFTLCGETISEH